jgi:pimeloyl-ACP methyl ester carboxylesterase
MKRLQVWTVVAILAGVGSPLVLGQANGPQNSQAADALAGKLADGSNYRVVRPAQWNGTLVLDLDFINNPSAPPSAIEQWMVASGYAIGGISREPIAYRFPQAVDDLLTVRAMFIDHWGTPKRTLSLGNSRGAFVSRIALERRPDIFVGALMSAGGGAGEVALHNAKLDALWALKQFSGVPLAVAGFSSQAEAAAEGMKIQEAVKTLQATPLGRARLALAAAFEQLPVWADGDQPPADTDYEAQLDQLAIGFTAGHPAVVRFNIEQTAGGVFSWNNDVDYKDLLSRSRLSPMVAALYGKAGADLEADLLTLARAPRITASPAAVAVAEKTMSYSGKISGPVLIVDNIGDPFDVESFDRAYERTVTNAGNGALLRMTWVRSSRHSTQSPLERLAGFSVLVERLDTGRWADTSPEAMNARATQIRQATAIDLGPARFIPNQAPEILRPWDGRQWGTYKQH